MQYRHHGECKARFRQLKFVDPRPFHVHQVIFRNVKQGVRMENFKLAGERTWVFCVYSIILWRPMTTHRSRLSLDRSKQSLGRNGENVVKNIATTKTTAAITTATATALTTVAMQTGINAMGTRTTDAGDGLRHPDRRMGCGMAGRDNKRAGDTGQTPPIAGVSIGGGPV